jgi:GTP-binding protein YchF
MRHRRAAECRQVHTVQRADADGRGTGCELSVLHHRAQHRRSGRARSALKKLAEIAGSKEIIPTRISFVDIAGLVRGASKGEGLGNKFLANIREVDAIVHVLRCFEDDDITHVEGRIDPVGDADTIETELMISDLESLERRTEQTRKRAAAKDKESLTVLPMMEAALKQLQDGKPVRTILSTLADEDLKILKGLNLLTSHPVLYVCNVSEADAATGNAHTEAVPKWLLNKGRRALSFPPPSNPKWRNCPTRNQRSFLQHWDWKRPASTG